MTRNLDEAEQAQLDRTLHNLSLQRPTTDEVHGQLDHIRAGAKGFAQTIYYQSPPSRERSLALTALEEATQWAIGAVVRNQADKPSDKPNDGVVKGLNVHDD